MIYGIGVGGVRCSKSWDVFLFWARLSVVLQRLCNVSAEKGAHLKVGLILGRKQDPISDTQIVAAGWDVWQSSDCNLWKSSVSVYNLCHWG
jgi:hypothetical protein